MTIDITKYKGHTIHDWVLNPTGGTPIIGVDLKDGGPLLPICDTVNGYSERVAKANARLIADAPKLLAEVVRLRKDLAEAVAALDDVTRLIIGECPALLDGDRDGDGRLAMRIDAVLAKHGGA